MPLKIQQSAGAASILLRVAPNPAITFSSFVRGPTGPPGVDSGISLTFKRPCIVATTAAIGLSGTQTIDGVAVVVGNRVLVKDQADDTQNGIYDVASGAWARSSDADAADEWLEGSMVYVTRGTALARTLWALTTTGAITLGATSMTFTLVTASPTTT